MPLFSEGGEGDSASFISKPLILVIIHSDAVATIKVRDKKEGAQFFGQVWFLKLLEALGNCSYKLSHHSVMVSICLRYY